MRDAPPGDQDLTQTLEIRDRAPQPWLFRPGDLAAGRFRVQRAIAEGGMGVVYEAIDLKLNVRCALKCAKRGYGIHLPPEVRNALRVTHPNVCRTFEIHSTETAYGRVDFLTMELIDGGTLSGYLKAEGPMREAAAREVAVQICAGVAAAHAQKLLHRDLKASNILLARDEQGGLRAVVTDFGLAQERSGADTGPAASGLAGTPAYLAPERWRGGKATVASDIYALGVVLHELVAGRRPVAGVPAANLPARWRNVIARCLKEDPAQRYQSATAVAQDLVGKPSHTRPLLLSTALLLAASGAFWNVRPAPEPPARLAVPPVEARDSDPDAAVLLQGISQDLVRRLSRLRSPTRQLVIIPAAEARGAHPSEIRDRLGATHALRAAVAHEKGRLVLRASLVDTSTNMAIREIASDYERHDIGAITSALVAVVAEALHLPRQSAGESVAPAAYAQYALGLSALNSVPAYGEAVAAFAKAIALDGRSVLPRAGLAEACYNAWLLTSDPSWLTRGLEQLEEAARRNPDSIAVRLAAGKLSLAPGSYDRAAQLFQRAIQLDPGNAEAWRGLAQAYQGMRTRDSEAVASYLKAIELQPGYYRPYSDLGEFHRLRGNYVEAAKYFRRVTELAPKLVTGHANLGGLYSDMGRWAEAERELKRALEIDGRYRAALNNLGALYVYQGRDEEALKCFESARAAGPESYVLMLNLGDAYRRAGRLRQSHEAYRRGRELADRSLLNNPLDAGVRSFVAYFAARLGDREASERELAQALRFGGRQKTVIRRAVLCYEALGQRARALEALQPATRDVLQELNRQPDLASLRQDARFVTLLSKANDQRGQFQ